MLKSLSLSIFHNEELLSLLLVSLAVFLLLYTIFKRKGAFLESIQQPELECPSTIQKSRPRFLWTKQDTFYILIITILYSIVSLWNLGTLRVPESYWQPIEQDESIILYMNDDTQFDAIYWISGEGNNNINPTSHQIGANFQILGSNDMENWTYITDFTDASYMAWRINDGLVWDFRYILVHSLDKNNVLHEIGFRKPDHSGFLTAGILNQSNPDNPFDAEALIDEQDCLVIEPTYIHGTYFDEIYHPRNAYEIAEGQHMYASVHPLLGTSIIALGIKFLGLNTLGWRLPGAIAGILMLPLFYLILKRMFLKTRYAAIGTILLAADFMHYTTSRIGTLEPFSVLFILLMYWFMIDYYYTSFYDTRFKKTLFQLALCGISMAIAIATKWTGVYAAVGLAILFFTSLGKRYMEYQASIRKEEKNELDQFIISCFPKYCFITLGWCVLFFIIIPVIVYFAAYIPCMLVKNQGWSIQGVIDQTLYMFNYHANLDATHPFQSVWYQWIFNTRPIWYYYGTTENAVHTISAFGNPFIWWSGLISIIFTVVRLIKTRTKDNWLIFVSYFAQLAPWLLVSRCIFIYHYYPSVPFLIMAIVYVIYWLDQYKPQYKKHIHAFVAACIILFVMFLPVISGFGTTSFYINSVLRWMTSWYFG